MAVNKSIQKAEETLARLRSLTHGNRRNINYSQAKRLAEETADYYKRGGNWRLAEHFYHEAASYARRSEGERGIREKYNILQGEKSILLNKLNHAKSILEKKLIHQINEKEKMKSRKRLGAAFLSIASLAAALFSISMNITGNAIADIESSSFKWMGLCFFACGLVFLLVYLGEKKK